MDDSVLTNAILLIKNGKIIEAEQTLRLFIKEDPNSEIAWLWLSVCRKNNNEKIDCLNQVLRINPNNEQAKKGIAHLQNFTTPNFEEIIGQANLKQSEESTQINKPLQKIAVEPVNSGSVEFFPAVCPVCGGSLKVTEDNSTITCNYCGSTVILKDASRISVELRVDIQKTLSLASLSLSTKNFQEAINYCSTILEKDDRIRMAWIYKGYAIGMLSNGDRGLLNQSFSHFYIGIGQTDKEIAVDNEIRALKHEALQKIRLEPVSSETEIYEIINLQLSLSNFLENLYFGDKNLNVLSTASLYFLQSAAKLCKRIPADVELRDAVKKTTQRIHSHMIQDEIERESQYHVLSQTGMSSNIGLWKGIAEQSELFSREEIESIYDTKIAEFNKIQKTYLNKQCFIATASLGNPNHKFIRTLRNYRDRVLQNRKLGRMFIHFYYSHSPRYASIIQKNLFYRRISLIFIVFPAYIFSKLCLFIYHQKTIARVCED